MTTKFYDSILTKLEANTTAAREQSQGLEEFEDRLNDLNAKLAKMKTEPVVPVSGQTMAEAIEEAYDEINGIHAEIHKVHEMQKLARNSVAALPYSFADLTKELQALYAEYRQNEVAEHKKLVVEAKENYLKLLAEHKALGEEANAVGRRLSMQSEHFTGKSVMGVRFNTYDTELFVNQGHASSENNQW